jgi:hypothetical protein
VLTPRIWLLSYHNLTAPTLELAFQDAKARIRLVQTARWVGYPRAGVAVEELERRFNYPTCARMPCMLLYGDSGMGKSMILEKMERQHPSSYDQRRGITKRPVVIVQMPSSPDQRRFYTRILQVLGAPYSTHEEISQCARPVAGPGTPRWPPVLGSRPRVCRLRMQSHAACPATHRPSH